MRVAELRSLLKSIAETVCAAGGKQAANELLRVCETLDSFQDLTVSQFADFLAKADYYLQTGKFRLPGANGKKPGEADADRVKRAALSIQELYENSIAEEVQYDQIADEVRKLAALSKHEVLAVAREVGIFRRLSSKADALKEIQLMIEQRKESFQRTAF